MSATTSGTGTQQIPGEFLDAADALFRAACGLRMSTVKSAAEGDLSAARVHYRQVRERFVQPGADLVRAERVSGVWVEAGPSSPLVSPGPRPDSEIQWECVDAPTARGALIPGVERALFGTTDGGLLGDDEDVPVGELRRLLREVWSQDGDAVWSPGARLTPEQRELIGRPDEWWQGYRVGCEASHSHGCDAVEAERDDLRERLAQLERHSEQRVGDLQAEMRRQFRAVEQRVERTASRGVELAAAAAEIARLVPDGAERYRVQRAVRAWEEAR